MTRKSSPFSLPPKEPEDLASQGGLSGITCIFAEVLMEVFPGITMDPEIRFGKPCIKGTRIDVATILGQLASGDRIDEIEDDYKLTRDQVMAVLAYAAHVAQHLPPAVKSA
jgi:uncharacterized protein (DUF433 family)